MNCGEKNANMYMLDGNKASDVEKCSRCGASRPPRKKNDCRRC